jgi:hypothetical protein
VCPFPNDRQIVELEIGIGAVLASVALSMLHLVFDPLPNPDGVIYLLAAQAWLEAGYGGAAAIYPLPFYSILIASVHALSGLPWLTSAHCLNGALIAGLIVGLQRLSAALGGGLRVQAIVVVLALLLPELNGYRSFLLRDFGYWMFAIFALALVARHAVAPTPMRAAGFVVMCVLAAAFRAEAVPLLLVMPVALLLGSSSARAVALLCIAASIAIALGAAAILGLSGLPATAWLSETLQQGFRLAAEIPARVETQVVGFGAYVLDPKFHDYAAVGVAGGLVAMIIVHIVNAASLPLAAVALAGLATGTWGRMDRRARPVLIAAFAMSVIALAVVVTARGIIQTRYAMSAALLIVVIAAFAVDGWYGRAGVPRARLRWASALLVAYFIVEAGFGLLNSKHQYIDAAAWLARNTASDARIFSNDLRVLYLADRQVDWRRESVRGASETAAAERYDFWVIDAARGRSDASDDQRTTPVAQFENRKGQRVSIYSAGSRTTEPGRARGAP